MVKRRRLKRAAWVRRVVIGVEPGGGPPVRYGDLVIHGARYLGKGPYGCDQWLCFGWKPHDASAYRLRKYNPGDCPVEATPLGPDEGEAGFEVWVSDLRWLVRGD
jgi:hypothetical protein